MFEVRNYYLKKLPRRQAFLLCDNNSKRTEYFPIAVVGKSTLSRYAGPRWVVKISSSEYVGCRERSFKLMRDAKAFALNLETLNA